MDYISNMLKINSVKIADNVALDTWYKLVITAAADTKKCQAKLYDASGSKIGETAVIDFIDSIDTVTYYAYRLSDKRSASEQYVDFNDLRIYKSEIDEEQLNITIDNTNLSIPSDNTDTTVNLSVSARTTDGWDSIDKVVWSVDDTADGVTIMPDENNSKNAVLKVSKNAPAGGVTITASVGGKTIAQAVHLTGENKSVAFNERAKSMLIPSGGSKSAQFTAQVRNSDGTAANDAVSYSLCASDGTAIAPTGISINADTSLLTVDNSAAACEVYVKAVSGDMERQVKVIIYSLQFTFGGVSQIGYTNITASTAYNRELGFGIEGSAASTDTGLEGNDLVFKANVTAGNVYKVTVKYKGKIAFEKYDRYLTGIEKDTTTALTEKTYEVAVVGDGKTVGKGVLDINLRGSGEIASVKIEQLPDKTDGAKPAWIEIGDSTVAQNPSWGYVLAGKWNTYPELSDEIEDFKNMGRGARQLTSFYNEGLLDTVLKTVRPGDVVSISGMGTNGYSGAIDDFKAQLNYYIDSVIEMGGKVILGSYTPNGNWGAYKGKVYNAQTETFTGKRYDDYDVALYEVYQARKDENGILGYVDIGAITDALMTAEVKKARDAAGGTGANADAAAAAKAEALLKWYPNDFNHYTGELSNLILPELTRQVAEITSSK